MARQLTSSFWFGSAVEAVHPHLRAPPLLQNFLIELPSLHGVVVFRTTLRRYSGFPVPSTISTPSSSISGERLTVERTTQQRESRVFVHHHVSKP